MAIPSTALTTELDAVNQILASVGQAPVTNLNLQNPEVAIALSSLREVNRMVLAEGWTFNTERHLTLQPDAVTKFIQFPDNALSIDTNCDSHRADFDPVRRDGKLYDKLHHTFEWDDPIDVDVIWYYPFTEIPPVIQAYVTARAARICAVKMIGDMNQMKMLQEQEGLTRAAVLEYECQQGDYTMFGWGDGQNYHSSYEPFQSMIR